MPLSRSPFVAGPMKKILGNLNFGRSEFFGDLIAPDFGENVAALYYNDFARLDLSLRK